MDVWRGREADRLEIRSYVREALTPFAFVTGRTNHLHLAFDRLYTSHRLGTTMLHRLPIFLVSE